MVIIQENKKLKLTYMLHIYDTFTTSMSSSGSFKYNNRKHTIQIIPKAKT